MDARSPGRDARPRGRTVFSFAAKLLTALLTAVGMVLVITLLVVRQQTAAQVRAATERVTAQSRDAFREMEAVQRLQMAHQGRAFTESPRTSAALEAALESGDMDWLAETARYELALGMTAQSLAAFTDGAGVPVITLLDGAPLAGDAAGIQPLVAQLTAEHARELLAYRVVRGRLYLLQLRPLELDARLIGTVAFGLPVDDDDADRLGAMLGAELCFVADDRCIAGTAAADETLRTMLVDHARHGRGAVVGRPDGRRLIVADAIPGSAPETWRVMAVPIEGVLRPFADIRRALHLSGLGAFALAVVLSTLLSRGLTRPVRALVAATVRVGRGDYDVRVPVARRDELGVLGGAFNAMTEGLRLKERYRGVLDKVVSPQVAEDLMRGEITLGGETREVTTLFADITAFSDLVDGMEPQKVIALLNECMARLEAVVHAHGGVVDKYIGDEIMVIFGAPVARADHVTHAVEAALDMQDSMQRLNEERACRGEPAITLAIGVHTGPAVAGNMGSPNRLNYTVVGDSVNLAKRLCSSAGAGRVVLTESTWKRVQRAGAGNVRAQALGPRSFKGFARPIAVVAVERVERAVSTGVRRRVAALLLAGLLAAGARAPLHAQSGGLPTLEDLGLRYSSASGAVQLGLSGRVDLEGYMPEDEPTWLIPATNAFVAGRARLFADLFIGERVYGLAELRADRGHAPDAAPVDARVEQAFLRVRPFARPAVMLQAGKFASPFGAYAARHHTDQDPLIRPPLPYDQRTLAAPRVLPGGLDGFLGWKDSARERRAQGAPVVWDVPYPWGALAMIGIGDLGARFAVTGSAPSGAPETWELSEHRLRHPNVMAGLAYRMGPELGIGIAWNRGPWLEPPTSGTLPAGTSIDDFMQETLAVDAAYVRGRTSVRAELFLNRWEVPNLPEDPLDTSFYVEGVTRLAAGAFVAARYGEIRFNRMGTGTTAARAGERWDLNQRRLQLGGGYRIVHNAGIRAEYLVNRTTGADPRDNLLSMQLWWSF